MQLLIVFILIFGLCQRLYCDHLKEAIDEPNLTLQKNVVKILKRIRLEQEYDTIVIHGSNVKCVFQDVLPHMNIPTVLFTKGSSLEDWSFSSDSLLLCCDSKAEQEQNMRNLLKLQQARRLIYLEHGVKPELLCNDYFEREQHNVAMINEEGILYSCRLFQKPNYIQLDIYSASNFGSIYVQQFQNMQGATIKSDTDQLPPRSMLYRNAKTGKIEMLGYVANLINTFVQRVNGTLQLSDDYDFGRVSYYGDIVKKTHSGQLDIGTVLTTSLNADSMDFLTYPFTTTKYCLMVPVPKKLPYMQIYTLIVDLPVVGIILVLFVIFSLLLIYSHKLSWRRLSFANVLLNDWCLRGLLGQSFPMPYNPSGHLKAICLILFFASLMITTMYNSYLQSFFTSPPTEEMCHSFTDLRKSPYKIAVYRNEVNLLLRSHNLSVANSSNAFVVDNWNDFVHMRDTYNASFAFPVPELRWRTYAEQQELFKEQAFYYSDDICLNRFVIFCVPLRKNLPYRQHFEQHMLYMKAFGLIDFWIDRSFFDMVFLNMTTLEDYSNPQDPEEQLYLRDLSYIFAFYIFTHLVACVCFGIECYWGRRTRRMAAVQNNLNTQ